MPEEKVFSETNLKYMYYFYRLYSQLIENRPQDVDDFVLKEICSIPWFHQRTIIDKSKGDAKKALIPVISVITKCLPLDLPLVIEWS